MTGYAVCADWGAEIPVSRSARRDKRLKFPQNWTVEDLLDAYGEDRYEDFDVFLGVYDNKEEAEKHFKRVCNECKSGYFWDRGTCFVKFDFLYLQEVEVEWNEEYGDLDVVDEYDVIDQYVAPMQKEDDRE